MRPKDLADPRALVTPMKAAFQSLPPGVRGPVRRGVRAGKHSWIAASAQVEMARNGFDDSWPSLGNDPVRLLVGPVNSAGQGWHWARVAQEHSPGVAARNVALANRYHFAASYTVPGEDYRSQEWARVHEAYILSTYTHVLSESTRPLMGWRYGREVATELPAYRSAGVKVACIAHGSDVRLPSRHVELEPWSPFRDAQDWDLVPVLQDRAAKETAFLEGFDGHVLVSTPDLLDFVPRARWCPVGVDVERWQTVPTTFERARPVVVHIPSASRMKGSELIDPHLQTLHDKGVIDYRRTEHLRAFEVVEAYQDADVVVDQFRIGSYGVAACEGMAAGRVVVGHVSEANRRRVTDRTGLELPILQATPDTITEVIDDLVADREAASRRAVESQAFVRAVHTGRYAADALTPFLAGARP